MFRITRDPSSGRLVQCLAKITVMFLSCPLTWTYSVLWQHICLWCVCTHLISWTDIFDKLTSSGLLVIPPDKKVHYRNNTSPLLVPNLSQINQYPTAHSLSLWSILMVWGTWWCSWLRHCATSRKVAGSIPDGVGISHWHNPSGHITALWLTQPLAEMSEKGKGKGKMIPLQARCGPEGG